MTEINRKKLRISSILIIVISLLELVYGFLVDHIITDVSLFLLVVSSYLVYRTNGNTLTLVEKWQKKYGLELKEKDLLVEKKTKPAPDSIWLWTAFILALRDLVVNLTSVFYYPINDPNPLAGLD